MKAYTAVGVMSGSSCDGLDISLCTFIFQNGKWRFELHSSQTQKFSTELKGKLNACRQLSGYELRRLDVEFGHFIGTSVNKFLHQTNLPVDLIASHGHTVFHDPANGINLQIGDGNTIASLTKTDVIYDFRTLDIQRGGRGAPLVPVGDKYLFADYEACLNLGGIANVTINKPENFKAFDICAFNQLLNMVSLRMGHEFDNEGNIGKTGKVLDAIIDGMNNWSYYKKNPGTISNEMIERDLFPLLSSKYAPEDLLKSLYVHLVEKISEHLNTYLDSSEKLFITGGGAYNRYFVDVLKRATNAQLIIPDKNIISFKEAIIFAFLGVLRLRNEPNCLSAVTGSKMDSVCGVHVKG